MTVAGAELDELHTLRWLALAASIVAPDWHRDALCREYPSLNWFALRGDISKQQAVCARCLAQTECREAGASHRNLIWAGEQHRPPKQQQRIEERAAKAAAAA